MSDIGYLKCACSNCQGHIEFPDHAAGISATCPHCGLETSLTAPVGKLIPPSPPPAPPPPKPLPTRPSAPAEVPAPVASVIIPLGTSPTGVKLKRILNVVWSVLAGLAVLVLVGLKVWKYFRRAENVSESVRSDPKAEQSKPSAPTPPQPAPVAPTTAEIIAKGTVPARKSGEDLQVLNFEVQKARDGNLQYIVGVVTNHSPKQFFNVKLTFGLTRQGGKIGDTATDTLRNLPANVSSTFKVNIIGTAPVGSATLAKIEGEKE